MDETSGQALGVWTQFLLNYQISAAYCSLPPPVYNGFPHFSLGSSATAELAGTAGEPVLGSLLGLKIPDSLQALLLTENLTKFSQLINL